MCNRKGYTVVDAQSGQANASATSGERQKHVSALYVELNAVNLTLFSGGSGFDSAGLVAGQSRSQASL
jgi:hypothetical protein